MFPRQARRHARIRLAHGLFLDDHHIGAMWHRSAGEDAHRFALTDLAGKALPAALSPMMRNAPGASMRRTAQPSIADALNGRLRAARGDIGRQRAAQRFVEAGPIPCGNAYAAASIAARASSTLFIFREGAASIRPCCQGECRLSNAMRITLSQPSLARTIRSRQDIDR